VEESPVRRCCEGTAGASHRLEVGSRVGADYAMRLDRLQQALPRICIRSYETRRWVWLCLHLSGSSLTRNKSKQRPAIVVMIPKLSRIGHGNKAALLNLNAPREQLRVRDDAWQTTGGCKFTCSRAPVKASQTRIPSSIRTTQPKCQLRPSLSFM
jgi:hypothetical protein